MNDPRPYQTDTTEIDLRELILAIWDAKLLIFLVTIVVVACAAAYAFLATPEYEARTQIAPPTASDLASYNAASQLTGTAISGVLDTASSGGIDELTPEQAYAAFLSRLRSMAQRQQFFDDYYLPSKSKQAEVNRQQLWRKLEGNLQVKLPDPNEYAASVTIEGESPEQIAEWANLYVQLAMDATKKQLLDNLNGEVQVRRKGVEDQIATLRTVAKTSREARITRLKNALAVAKEIGLESPAPAGPLISIGNNDAVLSNGDLTYLRGAKSIQSELELLEKRTNDDAYIPELSDLLKKKTLLEKIDLSPDLAVARVDALAIAPEDPIKPRKALIIAVGLLVGLLLSGCIVLIRVMIKTRR